MAGVGGTAKTRLADSMNGAVIGSMTPLPGPARTGVEVRRFAPGRSGGVRRDLRSWTTSATVARFLLSLMDQHLTISEARDLTGKSESTIKRLLREIVAAASHPDRASILPPPDEVERRKAAKEPYAWKIDRQLLLRRFPQEGNGREGSETTSQPASASPGGPLIVQILQEQLQSKDEQIRTLEKQLDRKDEQIASSNERLRESNVLMRELQQRLSLAAPLAKTTGSVFASVPPPSQPANDPIVESNSSRAKSAKPSPAPTKKKKPAPKRGILARLFGWR